MSPAVGYAEQNVKLDGISFEGPESPDTLAIMNNEFLKKDDTLGDYRILEINKTYVLLQNLKTNQQKKLAIGESTLDSQPKEPAKPPVMSKTKEEVGLEIEGIEENGGFMSTMKTMIQKAKYTVVMVSMRKIHNAASIEYAHNYTRHISIKDLVKGGYISPKFNEGAQGGYNYRVEMVSDGPRVHATPVDIEANPKHFMIDSFGDLYAENGKPATRRSGAYTV